MKSTKIFSAIVIMFAFMATSCSSDSDSDSSSFTEESPFARFLTLSGYDGQISEIVNGSTTASWGLIFQPTAKGTITALVIKSPAAKTGLNVKIWDADRNLLRTEIVNIPTANVETVIPIEPLALQKNNVYAISMFSNSVYYRTRTDSGIVPFPITVGNIKILNVGQNSSSPSHAYPYENQSNYCGDLCFKFLRTE